MGSKEYFDEIAPQWDRLQESFFSNAVRDKALSIADVQPGFLTADIGCGTGFITEGLIKSSLWIRWRRAASSSSGLSSRLGFASRKTASR